jgi:hypothetical protein
VARIFLLTMTVAASPLGRLQLCGSELANKLAEICSVQGYNDPFRNNMYYGECNKSITGGVRPCQTGVYRNNRTSPTQKITWVIPVDVLRHFTISDSYHFRSAVT